MPNPWIMKMEQFTRFTDEEREKLEHLSSERLQKHEPKEDIIREGDHSPDCHVIISGLAARYTILPDGERQIMAFLIPGDLCDAEIFILKEMDHSVGAITPTVSALISGEEMKRMLRGPGALGEALWWGTLTDLGVLRERIVDHGRRSSYVRLAHLVYELLVRYRVAGLSQDNAFEFPVTQDELADATGMTPVHANRMLQKLRREGLIILQGKVLKVINAERLKQVAGFEGNYLHLDRVHEQRDKMNERAGDLV